LRFICSVFLLLAAGGCGAKYDLPALTLADVGDAEEIVAAERMEFSNSNDLAQDSEAALREFFQVIQRVKPEAEQFCNEQNGGRKAFNCDVNVVVDERLGSQPNAFQYFDSNGRPTIEFNLPFILQAKNPEEIAFTFGHEVGHLIADHVEKTSNQKLVGEIVIAPIVFMAQAYVSPNPFDLSVSSARNFGRSLVGNAYSQTYELEADLIGTYIAERAGYDPVLGVRIFARTYDVGNSNYFLRYLGTHPPSEERIAMVAQAMESIRRQRWVGATPTLR